VRVGSHRHTRQRLATKKSKPSRRKGTSVRQPEGVEEGAKLLGITRKKGGLSTEERKGSSCARKKKEELFGRGII